MPEAKTVLDGLDDFFVTVSHKSNQAIPDAAVLLAPDPVALGWLLARLRKAKAEISDACQLVEDEMVKCMEGKEVEIPGVGVAEMHTGAKRTEWDKDGVNTALCHVIAHDMPVLFTFVEEGKEDEAQVNNIDLVRDVLSNYHTAATPSFKVTGLRAMGISPDDYCQTAWGRKTIQMPALEAGLVNPAEVSE